MPAPFNDLPGAYAWLNAQVNYERHLDRIDYTPGTFDIEAFRLRLESLGSPQRMPRTIHIAGTRGKGSAALILETLLRAAGLTTAVYTSPHLREYRERIRINGQILPGDTFTRLLALSANAEIKAGGGRPEAAGTSRLQPPASSRYFKTVFEHLTALFFLAAREAAVDWAIVETGLGGRLDATNVLDPGPVLLTRIGLEHTHLLGGTIPLIAAEKAAILKPGGWAVAGAQDPAGGAAEVFQARAREIQSAIPNPQSAFPSGLQPSASGLSWAPDLCPLLRLEPHPSGLRLQFEFRRFVVPPSGGIPPEGGTTSTTLDLDLALFGEFQAENIQNALAMLARLEQESLVPSLSDAAIAAALARLRIPGRMERVCDRPELFADGGHCPTAAAALARTMQGHFGAQPAGLLVGMMTDKDHDGFFRALAGWPHWAWLGLYRAESPRAADPEVLAQAANRYFHNIKLYNNLEQALQSLPYQAEKLSRTVATGSLYSIARLQDWGKQYGSGWTPAEVPAETQ